MKRAKKALRIALCKAEKARIKKLRNDLEQLKSRDPSEYWRRLYQLNEFEAISKDCLPELVKNSSGQLVSGKEGIEVWQESFRKLGLESSDFNDYDTTFYQEVKQSLEVCDFPVIKITMTH